MCLHMINEGWPVHASPPPFSPDHVREIWASAGQHAEISPAPSKQRDETGVVVWQCASAGHIVQYRAHPQSKSLKGLERYP